MRGVTTAPGLFAGEANAWWVLPVRLYRRMQASTHPGALNPVDRGHLAGDERCIRRRQESYDTGDFGRIGDARQRSVSADSREGRISITAVELDHALHVLDARGCPHPTRTDGVEADILCAVVHCGLLGQHDQSGLGGGVGRHPGERPPAGYRGDVDDRCGRRLPQVRDRSPDDQHRPGEIHRQSFFPVLDVAILDCSNRADTCIVDDDVQDTVTVTCRCRNGFDEAIMVGDIGDNTDCGAFGQACYERLKGFGSAADSAHPRAISHQSPSNRLTDARPSAGHEAVRPMSSCCRPLESGTRRGVIDLRFHDSIVEPTRVLERAVFFLGAACPGYVSEASIVV